MAEIGKKLEDDRGRPARILRPHWKVLDHSLLKKETIKLDESVRISLQ